MDDIAPSQRRLPQASGKLIAGILAVAVVAAAGIAYRAQSASPATSVKYLTATVQKGDLSSGIAATGPIAAVAAVPLNFKLSGRVVEIGVRVGDKVGAGQVLAKLDPADLQTQLRQAEANLATAQAKLEGMLAGPRQEQVAQLQSALDTAKQKLVALQTGPRPETVAQAQASLLAAQAKLQQLKDGPSVEQRRSAQQTVEAAKVKLNSANVQKDGDCGPSHPEYVCKASQANALAAQQAVDAAQSQYDALVAPPTEAQLAQAQAAVDAAQQALQLAQAPYTRQDIKQAQDAMQMAEQQLKLAQSPYTEQDLDGARAQAAAQQALVELAQANLDSATLSAPSAGVVTAINGAVGQWLTGGSTSGAAANAASGANNSTANASSNFISLTDLSQLQVDAQVNEADVGRVKPGQPVRFTVDAFPGQTFDGQVAVVQPLGITNQNVVYYTVIVDIAPTDMQLLPGMTASVTILTTAVHDAVLIPSSAISFGQSQATPAASPSPSAGTARGGAATVIVVSNGAGSPRQIQTGASDDRNTQVLSGLSPGEEVAVGVASGNSP